MFLKKFVQTALAHVESTRQILHTDFFQKMLIQIADDLIGLIGFDLNKFRSASQMLDFFGYEQYGKLLLEAIEDVLVEGACLSPELGGTATTREVGDAVKRKVEELFQR